MVKKKKEKLFFRVSWISTHLIVPKTVYVEDSFLAVLYSLQNKVTVVTTCKVLVVLIITTLNLRRTVHSVT